jgi:geranylgeranyl reductase
MQGLTMKHYDVVVIGGGPGGSIAAKICADYDLHVLLVEKGGLERHKPCGGILPPICTEVLLDILHESLPKMLLCSPPTLGLYYIPPSGIKNGGYIRNYQLLNIHRDAFDHWLRQQAHQASVDILYHTEFLHFTSFQGQNPITLELGSKNTKTRISANYVIGADGVHSQVRKQISRDTAGTFKNILQESWHARGEFEDYFYAFFHEKISSTYAYVIPKDNCYLLGVGASSPNTNLVTRINEFKAWLQRDFAFTPLSLLNREAWAIPYGDIVEGSENVILIGDAAGLCNSFSGEGIRLAMESGVAAGYAVHDAMENHTTLELAYHNQVEWVSHFVYQVHEFTKAITPESMEDFVKAELARFR